MQLVRCGERLDCCAQVFQELRAATKEVRLPGTAAGVLEGSVLVATGEYLRAKLTTCTLRCGLWVNLVLFPCLGVGCASFQSIDLRLSKVWEAENKPAFDPVNYTGSQAIHLTLASRLQ